MNLLTIASLINNYILVGFYQVLKLNKRLLTDLQINNTNDHTE